MKFTELQYYQESFKNPNWLNSDDGLKILMQLLQTRVFSDKDFLKNYSSHLGVSSLKLNNHLSSNKLLKQLDEATIIHESLVKKSCENEIDFWEDPKDYLKSGKMTSNKSPLMELWDFMILKNLVYC